MNRFIFAVALGVCLTAAAPQAADKQCKADPRGNGFGYGVACGAATATIGVDGGTVTTPAGASVTLPFGAVDNPTLVTITTGAIAASRDTGALSPVYQFGPEGMVFARPVTVSLPLPPGVTDASIYFSKIGTPTEFAPIGGTIANGFITVQTPHFSFAFIGAPSAVRTVNGVGAITWISATSRQTVLQDFATIPAEALVDDGTGNLVSISAVPGTGPALGTFTISGVPEGAYLLHAGSQYMVTSTSAPDLGASRGGRPDMIPMGTHSAQLAFHLTNLAPWQSGDLLELFSTEVDDWDFGTERFASLTAGQTALDFVFDLRNAAGGSQVSLIEGSKGDHLYFAQLSNAVSSTGTSYRAMSRLVQFPLFDTVVDGLFDLAPAGMLNVQQLNSTAAELHGDQFKSLIVSEANPNTTFTCGGCTGSFSIVGQAGTAKDGFYTSNSDLLVVSDPTGSVVQSGTVTYGSPANTGLIGNWGEIGLVRWAGRVRYALPGKTPTQRGLASGLQLTAAASDLAAPRALVPTLSFVRHMQIDGINGFAAQSLASLTPMVSWEAPQIGTPTRYAIQVVEVFASGTQTQTQVVASISTPNTSFRIPSGILQSGHFYAFEVLAWDAPDQSNAPFRTVLDAAFAVTPSGLLTAP